jgi:hypothetical protein
VAAGERRALLVDKFEELDRTGRLDAALAKKRAKNAARDRRHMPDRREE